MTVQEKFLGLYKDYEQLLRASGTEPKTVEDESEGQVFDRLRMCRQFRNYFSHVQDPGFLEPTDKMMKFLASQVDGLKSAGDVVKKHVKKPEACMASDSDKISDVQAKFVKFKRDSMVVVCSDGSYRILPLYDTIGLRGSAKVSTLPLKLARPVFCKPLDAFVSLDSSRICLCTDTGTADGKLLGQVWF